MSVFTALCLVAAIIAAIDCVLEKSLLAASLAVFFFAWVFKAA